MIGSLGYLTCGDEEIEIFNCARVHSYLRHLALRPDKHGCCPDISPYLPVGCPTLAEPFIEFDNEDDPVAINATYELVPGIETLYTTPEQDGAWWYRSGRPESAGFYGFEAIRVGGFYQSTTKKDFNVSTLPCSDLTYSAAQTEGMELVVEGILHGSTCCAVSYGYRALMQQLASCGSTCIGTKLRLLSTIPQEAPESCLTDYALPAETTTPWRNLYNVTMVEYPTITNKEGPSCGSCGCAPATWVRFVLRSNPGLFLDPVTLLAAEVPHDIACVVECEDICEPEDPFRDPLCSAPILPEPSRASALCYCPPVAAMRQCYEASTPDTMFDFRLALEVVNGSTKALRNLRVRLWEKIGATSYDPLVYTHCNTTVDIGISYIPIDGTWELIPGEGAFITVGSVTAPARQSLFTGLGQPRPPCVSMPSGDYIICLESDVIGTPSDATVTVKIVEMEPT